MTSDSMPNSLILGLIGPVCVLSLSTLQANPPAFDRDTVPPRCVQVEVEVTGTALRIESVNADTPRGFTITLEPNMQV